MVKEGKEKAKESGANGAMIGRGIFGTPWFFNEEAFEKGKSIEERLTKLIEHTKLF